MKNKQVILVVDDTPENLQVLGALLEEEYEVRIATNGVDALETVKESAPDLILLDILMPEMGGYEVCRHLKADANNKLIPVIFISALGMTEQKVEAFREGAVDYITKPFQTEEVLARVRTHLQLSKMEELKHEIAERLNAEELLKQQNAKLENQYNEYKLLSEKLLQSNSELEIAKNHAEESDRLKTAFLQNVSHEIRTPLNGIVGFSDLLQNEELSSDEHVAFAKVIRESSDRLLETVNNILDIAKIDAGQIVVHQSSFSINSMMVELYDFFSTAAKNKNITLRYHNTFADDKCIIQTDEPKLHQILTNLILNAIKFSTEGYIDYGYTLNDKFIEFYVKDTGIGILENMFEIIFERFRQGDSSISRGYEGAGLGLAVSKGMVTILGGTIWVESEINKGSTFYFTIPTSPTTIFEEIKKTEKKSTQITKQCKILIVEDDTFSFEYLSELFKGTLIETVFAANGEEAIAQVINVPDIDLILMDMKMPVMDGFEATAKIKKIKPKMPIIAQSAFAFREEIEKIIAVGCDDYVSKPIKKELLFELIIKYINPTEQV